jgi:molecular chaperone GrpE
MREEDDVIIEPESGANGGSEEELEAAESRVGAKSDKLKKDLEACRREKQEYLDGWQRAKADYVNALKRFEEERKSATLQGTLRAASAFIPAIDSLERAEAHGDVPEGFKAVARQLHEAVNSLGLNRFGEKGDTFDPALHDALGQDPAPSPEKDNTVSAVLEAGWKTADQVVRPAKVRVYQA